MRLILYAVVLAYWAAWVYAIPTRTIPSVVTAAAQQDGWLAPYFYASPKVIPTAWAEQVPLSTFDRKKRQATTTSEVQSTISPSTTATAKLGQLVVGNTKVSTLPAALCGFVQFDNGTGTGIEFVGCSGDGSPFATGAADQFWFNNQATCTASGSQFFCLPNNSSTTANMSGCDDITYLTSYHYSTTSFPQLTNYLSYSYSTYSYSCAWNTILSRTLCSEGYDTFTSAVPTTVTMYSYHTDTYQLTSQFQYSFSTSVYPVTNGYYTSGTYMSTTVTTTSIHTGYTIVPVNYDTQKLSCYAQSYQYCQTFQLNSLQAYQCYSSVYTSSSDGKTLTVLNLADLQRAYMGSTITMSSSVADGYTQYSFREAYATRALPATSSGTANASPSAYLAQLQSNPPTCTNGLDTSCAALYAAAQACWSESYPPGPDECFCDALTVNSCPNLCFSTRSDRRSYYNWVRKLCSKATVSNNFTQNWPEMRNRTEKYYEDLLPWTWTVAPVANATAIANCPSMGSKVASFAVINIIVGISSLFLGRRTVVQKLTFGLMGHPGSPTWPLVSILVVGLNLLANFVNAVMISHKTGYVVPPISTLVLFWMSRPRIAWLATALGPVQKEKSMYISLAASALLVETILQAIGTVFIGKTVAFGAKNGYYKINALQYAPKKRFALLMFSGALLWIVAVGFFYLYVIWNYLGVGTIFGKVGNAAWGGIKKAGKGVGKQVGKMLPKRSKKAANNVEYTRSEYSLSDDYPLRSLKRKPAVSVNEIADQRIIEREERERMHWEDALERMGLNSKLLSRISSVFIFMLLPFIGQWLFWVGFVGLFDDRYCPPSVWSMMSIWTLFSILGIFIGASH